MKKTLLFAIISLVFASCSENATTIIRGKATGLPDNTGVFLITYQDRDYKVLDSMLLKNGKFNFSVDDDYPRLAYIGFSRMQDAIPLILEKGEINIECDFDAATEYTVEGSPSNDLLNKYRAGLDKYNTEADSLSMLMGRYSQAGDSLMIASLTERMEDLHTRVLADKRKMIMENNGSPVAAYLLLQNDNHRLTFREADSMLNLLDPAMAPNMFVDELRRKRDILEVVSPGKQAPDFTMPTPEGTDISLSSLRGKYVLIDFWAAWCVPCMEAMPGVLKLYEKYKNSDFTILGVSIDTDGTYWREAIHDYRMEWPQVSDLDGWQTDVLRLYEITAIPHTVLIDKDGAIVGTNMPLEKIDEYLGELSPPSSLRN